MERRSAGKVPRRRSNESRGSPANAPESRPDGGWAGRGRGTRRRNSCSRIDPSIEGRTSALIGRRDPELLCRSPPVMERKRVGPTPVGPTKQEPFCRPDWSRTDSLDLGEPGWECRLRRSASSSLVDIRGHAERARRHSHAERGNEGNPTLPPIKTHEPTLFVGPTGVGPTRWTSAKRVFCGATQIPIPPGLAWRGTCGARRNRPAWPGFRRRPGRGARRSGLP